MWCYRCVLVGLTQYVTVMAGIAIGKSWQTLFISLLARQKSQILGVFTTRTCCLQLLRSWRWTRETSEGWPLLTFETEVNGDSKSANEKGPALVGSLGLSCCTRDFCPALSALVGPVPSKYSFLTERYFNAIVPIAQQTRQAGVQGRLSLSKCLWCGNIFYWFKGTVRIKDIFYVNKIQLEFLFMCTNSFQSL